MMFMNEWDIGNAIAQFDQQETPNLARGAQTLLALMNWTNENSDGWPYWPKPARAATRLMTLLQAADRFDPQDVTAAEMNAALRPVKVFLTRQNANHAGIIVAA